MKRIPMLAVVFFFAAVVSAQQVVNEAVIQMKIETTPGNDAPPSNAPEGAMVMRFGEGEMKSKLWFKNGMTKIESDMGMGTSQVIYDSKTKTTTTLFEAMGRKMGFYMTDSAMQKMMSSADTGRQRMQPFNPEVMIEYLSDSKQVAGMTCYKANIRYKNRRGEEQQQLVWYTPDFVMGDGFRFNDLMRMAMIPGLQKLKGFPVEFESKRPNGSSVHYQVTKVDLNPKIDDKVFLIPKDYDVKPMSEMSQGGGRGQMIFRIGN